ncbi:MAG: diguanylate cyclase [Candidatus Gastranaerophilales bacterium]|nr:diguanylate cyclase [Candidatus Gastranaerophilales bacterium]
MFGNFDIVHNNNENKDPKDLLLALKKFNETDKNDFFEIFNLDSERLFKEISLLRELSLVSSCRTDNLLNELIYKIAKTLQVEKCAIYILDASKEKFNIESCVYGLDIYSEEFSSIDSNANEFKIKFVTNNLFGNNKAQTAFIKSNHEIIGILAICSKEDNSEFNEDDEYFIKLCAAQIAPTIENGRNYKQLQLQTFREKIINKINNSIRMSLDLNTILNTAVYEIATALNVSVCSIVKFIPAKNMALVTNEFNTHGYNNPLLTEAYTPVIGNSVNERILRTLKSVIADDISKDSDLKDYPKTRYEIINGVKAKSILIVPIMFESGVFGTLTLNQCNKTKKWSQDDVQMIENIAFQIGIAINQSYLLEKIKSLAIKDELTGLINKRNFNERISAEIERAKRHSGSLSLAIFDIDFFKKFNDTWGHLAGDFVLRELGKIIKDNIRKSDIAARIGGEEFALILPETDINNGYEFLERLRNAIQNSDFSFQGKKLKVTISGGIIDIGQIKNKNIEINSLIRESIEQADSLLYKAKKHGRNRICMQ